MSRPTRYRLRVAIAASLLGAVGLASAAGAMRYVEFNVSLLGRRVLRASQGDRGSEDAATVWRYLRSLPLRSLNGYRIHPDSRYPRTATLQGKICLEGWYSRTVNTDRLRLVRSPADGKWRLAPEEVERPWSPRAR